MLKKILLTTVLLLSAGQAPGGAGGYSFEDGNGLLRLCRGDNNLDWGVCHSYLAGIHDAQGSLAIPVYSACACSACPKVSRSGP